MDDRIHPSTGHSPMTDELKKCPFCGNAPFAKERTGVFSPSVFCDHDDCKVQPCTLGRTLERAITAWNTRQQPILSESVNLDGEEVERVARDMFNAYPIHALSPALADAAGVEVGTPLTYDFILEHGGNHDGLLRLARAAIASVRALTTTEVNNDKTIT